MNLIVDIGNSTVKIAVFERNQIVDYRRLTDNIAETISTFIANYNIEACAWTSVGCPHPQLESLLNSVGNFSLHIEGTTPTPLICDYKTPETLGADRMAATVGANYLCPKKHLLIIDAGTCITYDYVNDKGHYIGGNISPGLGMRLRAMNQQTARLPLIKQNDVAPSIGYDTKTAILAGVIKGLQFEISDYIKEFLQQYPSGKVFVTGGNAKKLTKGLEIEIIEQLVEIGINQVLHYNQNR